jgi:uncharacterized protein YciU (UPF0263 family)
MVNGKSSLEKILIQFEEEKEDLQRQKATLRELERTDEIQSKLDRINQQEEVFDELIRLADDMADELGSLDLFLERIKQFSPVLIGLADSYSGEISPMFSNILVAIQKIDSSTLAGATDLYKARAKHIKVYYDALIAAGLPDEVVGKIVARQGAPYSLTTMLEQVFKRFSFQVKLNN